MLPLLLLACAGGPAEDTAPDLTDTEPDGSGLECDVLEIRIDGDDPPAVGDSWTVFLWCDDTLLLGATRLTFDPPEIASVEDNVATFLQEGDATLTMQVGSRRQTRTVTVAAGG